VVITDPDATRVVGFHVVNADAEGLYGRLMVVHFRYWNQGLAFVMLAFQAEYAAHYGAPGPLEHKSPIHLLKHKGHRVNSAAMKRLLEKIGYTDFNQDSNAPEYWRVAEKPAIVLGRAKSLGYGETGLYF